MTYRERREAKLERLEGWADGRESKAEAAFTASHEATAQIPFGQPILVGHHSERRHRRAIERSQDAASAGLEHSRTAERHREKAANIERQLATSIYSDDPDAVEQLQAKVSRLEAEREAIKAFNATCRKGSPDFSLLGDEQRRDIETTARVVPYQLGKGGAFPPYRLAYLGKQIADAKQRIERLQRDAAIRESGERVGGRSMLARYAGECAECGGDVAKGEPMTYYRATREVVCSKCSTRLAAQADPRGERDGY